jgi:hypothetical protein
MCSSFWHGCRESADRVYRDLDVPLRSHSAMHCHVFITFLFSHPVDIPGHCSVMAHH